MVRPELLIVAASTFPNIGGYEKQVDSLAHLLTAEGFDVTVASCTPGAAATSPLTPYSVVEVPARHLLGGTFPVPRGGILQRLVQSRDWRAIITNTRFFPTSFVAAVAARKKKVPLIHVEHGSSHPRGMRPYVTAVGWAYDHTAGRYIFRSADMVVAVSPAAARFTARLGARAIECIPNTTTFPDAAVVQPRPARTAQSTAPGTTLLFVGRLVRNKGCFLLLDALRILQDAGHDFVLRMVGEGPERSNLEEHATKAGISVTFTGPLRGEALEQEFASADFFVSPSYSEGFGLAVLEACARRLPVIISDCEGHLDLMGGRGPAFYHKVGDAAALANAIESAASDPMKAAGHAQEAFRSLSRKYNGAVCQSQWRQAIKRACGDIT